jgi:hypothetical protein
MRITILSRRRILIHLKN